MTLEVPRGDVIDVDAQLLRNWPLPQPSADGDKEERGNVLVIAGSREMPGALLLSATAALHAGAGKLTVATATSVARLVATALPEARVIELPETKEDGHIATGAIECVTALLMRQDAVLIGPGMAANLQTSKLARDLAKRFGHRPLVIDAGAMAIAKSTDRDAKSAKRFTGFAILTPHAGELASLLGISKDEVVASALPLITTLAAKLNAVIALKGATTLIAAPDGKVWKHVGGNVGLAISGSGDTLAGLIAGLAARGASPTQAAVWGVALHARAGELLGQQQGPLGYLARDLTREVPALMHALSPRPGPERL